MEKFSKRVDIRISSIRVVRGMVEVDEDGNVSVIFKKNTYHSPQELSNALDYECLVTADPSFLSVLRNAGYPAVPLEKRRGSLHVNIAVSLIDKLQEEALENGCSASHMLEQILKQRYKGGF